MFHFSRSQSHEDGRRTSEGIHAWLVGADIGCLAAAVHLIQDAKVPGPQIHILRNSASQSHILEGFPINRALHSETESITKEDRLPSRRILSQNYVCTNDLLSRIPSLDNSTRTIQEELVELENEKNLSKDYQTRVIANEDHTMDILDTKRLDLNLGDRVRIKKMMLASKGGLMKTRIMDIFNEEFFHGKFWSMWATKCVPVFFPFPIFHAKKLSSCRFAFQPWHNAEEFRRHLRYIHDFANLHTLSPIDCTPYELFNSIIIPVTSYLQAQAVDFKHNVTVLDVVMDSESDPTLVSGLKVQQSGTVTVISISPKDILIITLGSIYAGSTLGTNWSPPAPVPEVEELTLDDSWDLWFKLSRKHPKFGDPSRFCGRIAESTMACFLVTLNDWDSFERFAALVQSPLNTSTLLSFKDSNWRLSLNVPRQPHLAGQSEDTQLIWGYALSPSREGNFIHKPLSSCTGEEVLMEVLQQLQLPLDPILEHSITVTSLLPLATAQYLTRDKDDRPNTVPDNVHNMALIGQFVEIPQDTVFSMEYTIRGAQTAVYHLMGLEEQKLKAHKNYWDSFWTILL
ncbi:67 kDa myosin-cross-reactive antigen family protein [Penicillium maclennaniae]|uniref:67 kDa myosin-cross-reactive antigen family protein n=1 Tax=Penicillium maclennaniae TaxID=1343394 RepID=UPI0025406160|nr:67 kDa myosin-cross-reactive antigen family protein [Penicillium maclennaniae]KAJ5662640.1 67 kDa myosin-cross-reactive antigen family protein [Penicillium maclennaniae]